MKKCKQGYYYCYTDKKCKRIPSGYRIASSGYLRKENDNSEDDGDDSTNSNGNGNGSNGSGSGNGGSNGGGMSESTILEKLDGKSAKDKGYSLRDWFKGGGWKQAGGKYDGKPCAKQPGQTTKPYCRDPDDRAAMSKDERDKRAAKKRKEDPNPDRKGKAKIVTQKNSFESEGILVDEGKKDACYKKVKASAKVWPSAYASGRLVQCRKKGAANYGNKSESVEYSDWRDDFKAMEYEFVDIIKAEPIKGGQEQIDELKCWKGYKRKKGSIPGEKGSCVKAHVELEGEKIEEEKEESKIDGSNLKKLVAKAVRRVDADVDGDVDTDDMKSSETGEFVPSPDGKKLKPKVRFEGASDWRNELGEGAAWTKKSGKNKKGGLNEKGRKSYEAENPGSDLKAPSKKKGNKRRASFCARMKGMKKKLTSAKTARDPDSRINKSLRAWNCN